MTPTMMDAAIPWERVEAATLARTILLETTRIRTIPQ